jgi:hypothetical protein
MRLNQPVVGLAIERPSYVSSMECAASRGYARPRSERTMTPKKRAHYDAQEASPATHAM